AEGACVPASLRKNDSAVVDAECQCQKGAAAAMADNQYCVKGVGASVPSSSPFTSHEQALSPQPQVSLEQQEVSTYQIQPAVSHTQSPRFSRPKPSTPTPPPTHTVTNKLVRKPCPANPKCPPSSICQPNFLSPLGYRCACAKGYRPVAENYWTVTKCVAIEV
ncbi:unnamed protein product, partial [Closterium sp. NIES-65]